MASPSAAGGGGGEGGALMPSASKGKALMDDEAEGVSCGICLADARRAIRGELDCCAHHFCFVCIMAWARVESRCPFCKARFRTIRRPPVPGRFRIERIVTVAERNQVYHPLGNESSTVVTESDPYANTSYNTCNCSREGPPVSAAVQPLAPAPVAAPSDSALLFQLLSVVMEIRDSQQRLEQNQQRLEEAQTDTNNRIAALTDQVHSLEQALSTPARYGRRRRLHTPPAQD